MKKRGNGFIRVPGLLGIAVFLYSALLIGCGGEKGQARTTEDGDQAKQTKTVVLGTVVIFFLSLKLAGIVGVEFVTTPDRSEFNLPSRLEKGQRCAPLWLLLLWAGWRPLLSLPW
ncbi:MAG: hypothetical protein A3G93_06255 [Nitrospinae bacterium RIFCSPLOWO2_12_FULL_45_22]|nr:MAG: hypothetical protein A3G93_06255 [Nitrospinae bacterium RIFCSPLOWO2_12_FULL_45_22]